MHNGGRWRWADLQLHRIVLQPRGLKAALLHQRGKPGELPRLQLERTEVLVELRTHGT
jgi:hypothetical protein